MFVMMRTVLLLEHEMRRDETRDGQGELTFRSHDVSGIYHARTGNPESRSSRLRHFSQTAIQDEEPSDIFATQPLAQVTHHIPNSFTGLRRTSGGEVSQPSSVANVVEAW
jgi:hypothetical protein